MNLRVCLSRRLRVVFILFVVPVSLFGISLVERNPPVRPADAESPTLIWDVNLKLANTLPRNFRTTDDPLKESKDQPNAHSGLAELHASGSGEFTADSLKLLLARTHGPVTIFDLRQETHIFINGLPASWFATHDWANVGKSQAAIEADEVARVQSLQPGSEIAVRAGEPVKKGSADLAMPQRISVRHASIERDLVATDNAAYVRLTVTDHARPLDDEVDQFFGGPRASGECLGAFPLRSRAWTDHHVHGAL